MKKLIGRTIGITLAAVFLFLAVFSGIIVLFCPSVYGRIFSKLGNYSASTWCFEREYKIGKETYDLAVLVLNLEERDSRLNYYSYLLITDAGYEEYILNNSLKYFSSALKAEEYFYSKSAVSKFDGADFTSCVSVCDSFYNKLGYTEFSPIRKLIVLRGESFNLSQITELEQKINLIKGELSGSELSFAESDLIVLNSLK